MRLIIVGGRGYTLTPSDEKKLNAIPDVTEVVSGGAKGADQSGEAWAESQGFPVTRFPADWARYGRGAGPERNRRMAKYTDAVALFPGGKGTQSMYELARREGLEIYDYRGEVMP